MLPTRTLLRLLLVAALALPAVDGQALRTQNGSIILDIGGATLTLSGQTTGSSAAVLEYVTPSAMQASINTVVSLTQPQILQIQAAAASANTATNLTSTLFQLATTATNTAMLQALAATSAATAVGQQVNSAAAASANTATALTASISNLQTLTSTITNSSLTLVGSMVAAQLVATQAQISAAQVLSLAPVQAAASQQTVAQAAINAALSSSQVSVANSASAALGAASVSLLASLSSASLAQASAQQAASVGLSSALQTLSASLQTTTTSLGSQILSGSAAQAAAQLSTSALSLQLNTATTSLQSSLSSVNQSLTQALSTITANAVAFGSSSASLSSSLASTISSAAALKASLAATTTSLSAVQAMAAGTSTAVRTQNTVTYFYYDVPSHQVLSTLFTSSQAACVLQSGIWQSSTSTCQSPLAYGSPAQARFDVPDSTAIASCPTGYTPADCDTAMSLLRRWRLGPNSEVVNGDAWCAGTVDGTLNSDLGMRGMPGFWNADSNGQGARPYMCATGYALVVDQCTPAENGCVGRPSPYRPHLYCRSYTQLDVWMCMSLYLP